MKKTKAIELSGGATSLSKLLGISPGAVSQWGNEVPEARVWQLKVLRPHWFQGKEGKRQAPLEGESLGNQGA